MTVCVHRGKVWLVHVRVCVRIVVMVCMCVRVCVNYDCVHRGKGWLVHVRVCVCMGQGRLERVASGLVRIYMGEGRSNWRVGVCAWAGWEQSRRKKWCVGGKLEGLCKLNYLVNW